MSRFIDPTTDFGFKKIFGDEANKDIIASQERRQARNLSRAVV